MWAADCEKVVIEFLSTPSARRATLFSSTSTQMGRISIHALREEGDLGRIGGKTETGKFLSTPSARRATQSKRS